MDATNVWDDTLGVSHSLGQDRVKRKIERRATMAQAKRVSFHHQVMVFQLLPDDHDTQQWHTKNEMKQFKLDSIARAIEYLNQHPDQNSYYRTDYVDPITKTRRR